jgi:hypothetical protein
LPVGADTVQSGADETARPIKRFPIIFCIMWQNIVQSFRRELRDLSDTFSFAPDCAIWAALLVGVFVLARLVHGGLLALAHRVFRQRRPYLNRVLEAKKIRYGLRYC